ncbi:mucin-binding protein, partial [Lacticaseibacillus thailandensis]|uniref:mucin-binding protein n=1 Tax=Lacticaseibacillus thailandensis TaxID=381741 RepID=UPI003B84A844
MSTTTLDGVMDGTGVYTVTVPANYSLADGQSRAVNYRFTNDDSDDVTVHLTHAMQYGSATTTRTIHYVVANGDTTKAPADVTQVAHWRTVTDLVTGGSVATATDGYAAVTSPAVEGYTASGNVAAAELGATTTADLTNTTATVTYAPNAATLRVTYVDDSTGATVAVQRVAGTTDQSGTYTATAPAGYDLANGQATTLAYTLTQDDTDNLTVHLVHHMTTSTAATTRTIDYVVDGGTATAPAAVTQTAQFTIVTDSVTGARTVTTATGYAAVTTPALAGYTADVTTVAAATPDLADGDTTVTVTYTAVSAPDTGGSTTPTTPTT